MRKYHLIFFFVVLMGSIVSAAQECDYGACDDLGKVLERNICIKLGAKLYIADKKCTSYGCINYVQNRVVKCCYDSDCKSGGFCVDGECVIESCIEGEKICRDGNSLMCINGEYNIVEYCDEGCLSGECSEGLEKRGMSLITKILIGGSIIPAILILILVFGWIISKLTPNEEKRYKNRCVKCDAKIRPGQEKCKKCGKVLKQ